MYIVVPCRDVFSGCNLLADCCQFALISLLHCASLKSVPVSGVLYAADDCPALALLLCLCLHAVCFAVG